MAIGLDPKQVVSPEELLMSQMVSQEAVIPLLVEKGIFSKEEFLKMVNVGNLEMGKMVQQTTKEVAILMDLHTLFILIMLQISILFCLADVVVVLANLKTAVDRNASADLEIKDRLKSLISTLHAITNTGNTKTYPWLKENRARRGENG